MAVKRLEIILSSSEPLCFNVRADSEPFTWHPEKQRCLTYWSEQATQFLKKFLLIRSQSTPSMLSSWAIIYPWCDRGVHCQCSSCHVRRKSPKTWQGAQQGMAVGHQKNLSRVPPSSVQKSQREDNSRESSASQIKLFMQSRCVMWCLLVFVCVCWVCLFLCFSKGQYEHVAYLSHPRGEQEIWGSP